ncbi:alpha/beta hydrolase [Marivibrio halodurans]|uniref:Alpha/beta hydrolase n=1 Tax=Marivibrio halodurans TaxID=2039722 RepID=A0A8J7V2Z2_9PROT|nr:alpha/beta hydrolase [Marivibrio halodurans]MBP5857850.1 alpha/beta hydrolase [Marivibrio halodurans]
MTANGQDSMDPIEANGARFAVRALGLAAGEAPLQLIWAHGWGVDHRLMAPLAETTARRAANWLIDLPGFGAAPKPPDDWGTADYADQMAEWFTTLPRAAGAKRVFIGHSFGGRVAVQLAARHPDAVDAIVLIAGAGLQRKRGPVDHLRRKVRQRQYRMLRALARDDAAREALAQRFGSPDYRNAGAMRPIFVRVVREDLSDQARRVTCPALLVYGSEDQETPAEFGARYAGLMHDARFVELPGLDHYTVLGDGRHQVLHRLKDFLDGL